MYFFRENRRSLPRLPSSCSLQPASGIFSTRGSLSSDELPDSATLQTREEGACKLLALKAAMHVCYKPFLTPVLKLLIPGRHAQRSARVINRLNAHADTRENAFPKFIH